VREREHCAAGSSHEPEQRDAGEHGGQKKEGRSKDKAGQDDGDDCVSETSGFPAADESGDQRAQDGSQDKSRERTNIQRIALVTLPGRSGISQYRTRV
jgi:hypothetical protein